MKDALVNIISAASISDITSCVIAAHGTGSSGHGSMKVARQPLKIQTKVKKQ